MSPAWALKPIEIVGRLRIVHSQHCFFHTHTRFKRHEIWGKVGQLLNNAWNTVRREIWKRASASHCPAADSGYWPSDLFFLRIFAAVFILHFLQSGLKTSFIKLRFFSTFFYYNFFLTFFNSEFSRHFFNSDFFSEILLILIFFDLFYSKFSQTFFGVVENNQIFNKKNTAWNRTKIDFDKKSFWILRRCLDL